MSNALSGEQKVELLCKATLPQFIESLIRNYQSTHGKDPDRIVITTGVHTALVNEYPDYIRELSIRYLIVTTFVPSKMAGDNAIVVVSNDSGTKYLFI